MRRPWLDRTSKRDADPGSTPTIGDLTSALRARLDALEQAAMAAADGVEEDYSDFSKRAGAAADEAGAKELVSALNERMQKIGTDAAEVSVLLERYAEIAAAAPVPDEATPAEGPEVPSEPEQPAPADATAVSGTAALEESGSAAHRREPEVTAPDERAAAVSETGLEPEPAESEEGGATVEISEGIRLLATQMSLSGADRGEIERRLREDFGVESARAVVARLFGG